MILTKNGIPLPLPGNPSRFPFSDVPPVHAPECKKYIASRFLIGNLERGGDRPRKHSQGGHSYIELYIEEGPPPSLRSVPSHQECPPPALKSSPAQALFSFPESRRRGGSLLRAAGRAPPE